jgi:predicted Zn-dependent protease
MTRRIRPILLAISALSLLLPCFPARSQESAPPEHLVVIRDAETETLLHDFAVAIYRVAGLDPKTVRIVVLRDRAINAFVTTGNLMFIHTGLLMRADTALEVVGTMAHETGHVVHGDVSRAPEMAREAMWRMLGSLLIAGAAGVAAHDAGVAAGGALGGMSMAQRGFFSFSRGQEVSADAAALQFLGRLGLSARGLLHLFETLDQQELLNRERQDPFLLTHPLTRDRMGALQQHIAREHLPNDGELPAATEEAYRLVRAKLDGFLSTPGSVLRAYPETDLSLPAMYARATAEHRLSHRDTALSLMNRLLALRPNNPWFRELRGQILYESGRPKEAVPDYQAAVRLAADQPLLRQGLAQAMAETGDRAMLRSAINQLNVARLQDGEDPQTWHLLGMYWGQIGEIGQANLALAEEAALTGDIVGAKRFSRLAAESLPQGPARLRAQDIGNAMKKENRQ